MSLTASQCLFILCWVIVSGVPAEASSRYYRQVTCSDSSQFQCSNGTCLSEDLRCNFNKDCSDGGDESGCDSWSFRCDFENGLGKWVIADDADFEWKIHSGPTPTPNTGPSSDHLGNVTAKYLLFESSSLTDGWRARFISPELTTQAGSTCRVRFYHHMFGQNHLLNVSVADVLSTRKEVIWSLSGNQNNTWHFEALDVGRYFTFFQIIFEGVRTGYYSDIGLDDLSLSPGCLTGSVPPPVRTVKLVDGFASNEGRIEVYHNGKWGTICDDSFGMPDANVVCKELGFSGAHRVHGNSFFGPGQGVIWLDDVMCFGFESSIKNCIHGGWGVHNCEEDHSEDAGVNCTITEGAGRIRLKDGDSRKMGRLEVWHNDTWGTVCDKGFTWREANVVCRQLGHSAASDMRRFIQTSDSVPIWLDMVRCLGNESSITHCNHAPWGVSTCDHGRDVGIVCEDITGPPDGTVRLVDGHHPPRDGRVEIYHNFQWGTVCNHQWDLTDTNVVCRQLKLGPTNQTFAAGIPPGKETTLVWIQAVACSGNEERLTECSHSGFGNAHCTHNEDVAIACGEPTTPNDIRLVDGTDSSNGILEALFNDTWLPVCKRGFDTKILNVVCRQLGFRRFLEYNGTTLDLAAKMIGTYASCEGVEEKLSECPGHSWFFENEYNIGGRFPMPNECYHNREQGIVCTNEPSQPPAASTPSPPGISGYCRPYNSHKTYSGTAEVGSIYSPKHPDTYDFDLICTWRVTASHSQSTIKVVIDAFSTEEYRDKLEVFDGWSEHHPKIASWSGEVSAGTTVTTNSSSCFFKFVSDHALSRSGFKLSYTSSGVVTTQGPPSTHTSTTLQDSSSHPPSSTSTVAPVPTAIKTTSGSPETSTSPSMSNTLKTSHTSEVFSPTDASTIVITSASASSGKTTVKIMEVFTTEGTSQYPSDTSTAAETDSGGATSTIIPPDGGGVTTTFGATTVQGTGGNESGQSVGVIVGVLVGVVVLVVVVVIIVCVIKRRPCPTFKSNRGSPYARSGSKNSPSRVHYEAGADDVGYSNGYYHNPDLLVNSNLVDRQAFGSVTNRAFDPNETLDADVREFLERLGFEQYVPVFQRELITSNTLAKLTLEDLTGTLGIPLGPSKRMMEKIADMAPYEEAEFHKTNQGDYTRLRDPAYQQLDRSRTGQQGVYSSIQPPLYQKLSKPGDTARSEYSTLDQHVYQKTDRQKKHGPHYQSLNYGEYYADGSSTIGHSTGETETGRLPGEVYLDLPLYMETDLHDAHSKGAYTEVGSLYSSVAEPRNHSKDDPMRQGSTVSLISQSSVASSVTAGIPTEPPIYFHCPITNEIMQDPVRASDGRTYERSSIMRWLSTHSTSPVSKRPMTDKSLESCVELKRQINEWRKQRSKMKLGRPSTPITGIDC